MTTDLRTLIRSADPVTGDHYDDAALLDRSRRVLAARPAEMTIVDPPLDVVASTPGPRKPRRRRVIAVTAVAAALAAGVVAVPTLLGGTTDAHRQAAALLGGAAGAITATDPPATPGQYWKVTRRGFDLWQSGAAGSEWAVLVAHPWVQYVAVDGSAPTVVVSGATTLVRQLAGAPAPSSEVIPAGEGAHVSVADPEAQGGSPASWQVPDAAFLADLPRDPVALARRIRHDTAGSGNSADGEVVVTIADVLRSGLVPADLRAALYRVLADVPGVEVTADSAAIDGVVGVAFAYREDANGIRQELVVDPTNGDLVGEREVATEAMDGIAAGTVIGESATTRELVDRVPDPVERALQGDACTVAADLTVTCER